MEKEGKICPQCKINLTISLVKDTTNFQCQCGYGEQLKVEDYLANYCKNKTLNNPKAESLLKKGNDFLESYFKELYDKKINELKESIKLLEAAYEESHKRNKNILSLLQILEKIRKTQMNIYIYISAQMKMISRKSSSSIKTITSTGKKLINQNLLNANVLLTIPSQSIVLCV